MLEPVKNAIDIKKQYTKLKCVQRIADFVLEDLKEAGFNPELIKNNPKKPKTWRIESRDFLNDKQQKEFDKIKDESTELWKEAEQNNIRELRKMYVGR